MDFYGQSIYQFFNEKFVDNERGGIYSAISGDEVITEDKKLINTALALLTAIDYNDKDAAEKHFRDLSFFTNLDNYSEILESSLVVINIGQVKTLLVNLIVCYSLFKYANFKNNSTILSQAKSDFNFLIEKAFQNNFASVVSLEDEVLDSRQRALNIILAIYISQEIGYDKIEELKEKLASFCSDNGGIWSYLDSSNKPIYVEGKLLLDNVFLLLITTDKGEVEETLQYINQHYKHHTGGYWNKINKNNTVAVDSITSYYTCSTSPFPYKSMLDHAVFIWILSRIGETNSNTFTYLLSEIKRFYNSSKPSICMGEGSWFSTPTTPSVPLARLVMAPPHTLGAFAVGNTNYLPLHEKQATLQLIASISLKDLKIESSTTEVRIIRYDTMLIDTSLEYISTGKLEESFIDIKKYQKWLEKTKSGFGYGLTPYSSPLGFKSDKSPQNFSAMHVISDKKVLGLPIEDKEKIFLNMQSAQNDDGGFGEQAGVVSELFTTYCVVATSFILNIHDFNVEKCINFVKSCQNDDGGFGNAPGYPSDTWHTNFGVLILHLLNAKADNQGRLIQYLLSSQNDDGGFAVLPGKKSEAFSTFRVIDSLYILGIKIPNKERTVEWLKLLQDKSGGFHITPNQPISFVGTYHAIAALYLLDELPKYTLEAKKWFKKHQAKDGGFSKLLNHPSDTTDEGFISIHASYMLEKKINPYWIATIT